MWKKSQLVTFIIEIIFFIAGEYSQNRWIIVHLPCIGESKRKLQKKVSLFDILYRPKSINRLYKNLHISLVLSPYKKQTFQTKCTAEHYQTVYETSIIYTHLYRSESSHHYLSIDLSLIVLCYFYESLFQSHVICYQCQ